MYILNLSFLYYVYERGKSIITDKKSVKMLKNADKNEPIFDFIAKT